MTRRFNPENGEEAFYDFLAAGLDPDERPDALAAEPDTLALGDDRAGRSPLACTPDIRWHLGVARRARLAARLGLPADAIPVTIYLELSSADRFDSPVKLPARARRRNTRRLLRGALPSGQVYVTPEQYFAYKDRRLEAARRRHGVIIVLLRWSDQQTIFEQPRLLEDLVLAEMGLRLPIPTTASAV